MNPKVNSRESGQSTMSVLLGMVLGTLVIGGLLLFYFNANNASQRNTSRSDQEADAVKVLNRAGRDIGESARVSTAKDDEVIVEQESVDKATGKKVTRKVRYAVVDTGGGNNVLVRQADANGDGAWDTDAEVLARNVVIDRTSNVDKETKFEYKTAKGDKATNAAETGLVDITYVARTKKGLVTLKSQASVDTALGGTTNGSNGSPAAQNVIITVTYGSSGTATADVSGVTGTATYTVAPASLPTGVSLSIDPATGVMTAQVSTSYTGSVPSGDIPAGTYTVTGDNGSGSGNVIIRVLPGVATATAPSRTVVCGAVANNDTISIPNATGVQYKVNGANVAAGTVTFPTATVQVTAAARQGFSLTNPDATWSFTDDHTSCANDPVDVDAFPTAAPTSNTATTGLNRINWSGGQGPYTLARSTDGGSTWTVILTNSNLTTYTNSAPLGTQYRYRVTPTVGVRGVDAATQFPAPQALVAQGSDRDQDANDVPESLGYNTVRLNNSRALPADGIQEIWEYKSKLEPTGEPTLDPASMKVNTLPVDMGPAANCNGAAITGTTGCWRDNGEGTGSESVYVPVSYVLADNDTAKVPALASAVVMKNGAAYFPSYSRTMAATAPKTVYADSSARAYQAPGTTATDVSGGNTNASECFSTDGVRLVNANPTGSANSLYSCNDGSGAIKYSAYADESARTATGGVNGNAGSGAFCEYAGDPGQCGTRLRTAVGSTYAPSSTSAVPDQSQTVFQSGWGRADDYQVAPCNAGGCSQAPVIQRMRSFAGPFTTSGVVQTVGERYRRATLWNNACPTGCGDVANSQMGFRWNGSGGVQGEGDAAQYHSHVKNVGAATGVDTGHGSTTNETQRITTNPTTLLQWNVNAFPRASVGHDLWRASTSPSGRSQTTAFSAPPGVSWFQDSPFCKVNQDNGWAYGYAFSLRTRDQNNNVYPAGTPIFVRHMWWVGKHDNNWNTRDVAATRWRGGNWIVDGNGSWTARANWTFSDSIGTFGTQYFQNSDDGWTSEANVINILGFGEGIPNAWGAAHLRIETYVPYANAGYPDFADLTHVTGWYGDGSNPGASGIGSVGMQNRTFSFNNGTEIVNCSGPNGVAGSWHPDDFFKYADGNKPVGNGQWKVASQGGKSMSRFAVWGEAGARATTGYPTTPGYAPWAWAY